MRKVDFRLIPWLCVLYLLSFLDRSAIGNARLYGLEKELNLSSRNTTSPSPSSSSPMRSLRCPPISCSSVFDPRSGSLLSPCSSAFACSPKVSFATTTASSSLASSSA